VVVVVEMLAEEEIEGVEIEIEEIVELFSKICQHF
jgi:hypothetical protein